MATRDIPPLTDGALDILEELWSSDPDWAKDSLLVLRELREAREALDGLLDWALSNRGTSHEFVTCRSDADTQHPALEQARALLPEEK